MDLDRRPFDASILAEKADFLGRRDCPQQVVIDPVINPRLVRIATVVNNEVKDRHGRE